MLMLWRFAAAKALSISEGSALITSVGIAGSGICAAKFAMLLAACPQHLQACLHVWRIVLVGLIALAGASHVQWVKRCFTLNFHSRFA